MPNGRPVDQPNFWFADESVQNAYMQRWSPLLSQDQLDINWVAVGGLDSLQEMLDAAREYISGRRGGGKRSINGRSRAADPRIPKCALDPGLGTSCPGFPNLRKYKWLLKWDQTIRAAAAEHGVDRTALMAVLLYESLWLEPKTGPLAHLAKRYGTSFGIAQIQLGTAKEMLNEYYRNTKWGQSFLRMSDDQLKDALIDNIELSIRLAAAYMRHLKKTVIFPNGRHINDWEAAVAYAMNRVSYIGWKTGELKPEPEWIKRESYINGFIGEWAREYWKCVEINCDYLQGQPRGGNI